MSTQVEVLRIPLAGDSAEKAPENIAARTGLTESKINQHDSLLSEQITRLVHQVFFPPSGNLRKQIIFSAVDEGVDVDGICLAVAEALSARVSDKVAIIAAHAWSRDAAVDPERRRGPERLGMAGIRGASKQLTGNLWSVPGPVFWGADPHAGSPAWVRARMGELRSEFDYNVLHAPAAGIYSGTSLLGQVSDGLVLVIEANYTRRSAAQKAKEMLHASNVKVLGTVLSGRTFPIPESLYRML
jgi:hypothetical protein